jgi:hypothetical protein
MNTSPRTPEPPTGTSFDVNVAPKAVAASANALITATPKRTRMTFDFIV